MDFMNERITEDAGEEFAPSRYGLKSKNDSIVKPYGTYELFFEITFQVLQKLGAYEDIGTPEECRKAMERQRGKKVNNRTLLRDLNGNPYTVRGDCPNCGNVNLVEINTSYCNTCGQKLDWNE